MASRKNKENLGIDYDLLYQEFLEVDHMNFQKFMRDKYGIEDGKRYSRGKVSGWVTKKKKYIDEKVKKLNKKRDKKLEKEYVEEENHLLSAMIRGKKAVAKKIIYLADIMDDENKIKKTNLSTTKELLDLLNFAKVDNNEATEITKNEVETTGFNIFFD